jgi:hypothetical protein
MIGENVFVTAVQNKSQFTEQGLEGVVELVGHGNNSKINYEFSVS